MNILDVYNYFVMCAYHDDLLLYSILGLVKRFIENLTLAIIGCKSVISNLSGHQNHLEGLLNHGLLGSISMISDLEGPGWDQIICISNKHPTVAGITDLGITI